MVERSCHVELLCELILIDLKHRLHISKLTSLKDALARHGVLPHQRHNVRPQPPSLPHACLHLQLSLGGDGKVSDRKQVGKALVFCDFLMGFHQKASFQNELFCWGIFVVAQIKRSWGLFYNFSSFFWYCFSSKSWYEQFCSYPAYIGHPLSRDLLSLC